MLLGVLADTAVRLLHRQIEQIDCGQAPAAFAGMATIQTPGVG